MVALKTKSDKHTLDNEKRRQSIKEKQKTKLNQSQIIKQALSNISLSGTPSKKIKFDDYDAVGDNNSVQNVDKKKNNEVKKTILFDDSDSEGDSPTITEKAQFSGKKGFELLNLQSTYGNDERFKIDERFLEDEKEDCAMDDDSGTEDQTETSPTKEKKKMLNILGTVLDEPVTVQENAKVKKRQYSMIRYDATNKEHEIYEIKPDPEANASKKKKLRKLIEENVEERPVPQVSKEKFYEVSGEIKNSFKEKEGEGQFSLLQTYGADDMEDEEEMERLKDESEDEVVSEKDADEFVSEEKIVKEKEKKGRKEIVEPKEQKQTALAQGIWKESFFFEKNDTRFKDGLDFMNKKNSTEAKEAAENYDQTRKKLKEILRLHMKKQLQKKDPFRNKIGGRNKSQLANSRLKNKVIPSKKKPFKKKEGKI